MRQRFDERPQEKAVSVGVGVMYTTICYNIVELEDGTWEADVVTIETTGGEPTDEQVLEAIKQDRLAALAEYDSSDAVNGFEVVKDGQTITTWIEPDKRSNYRGSLDDCVLLGVTDIEVPIAGMLIPMTVADARAKLAQIQLYADRCTIVTESHKAAILALQTVEEVEQYDFTVGYPSKLVFTLGEANGTVNDEELFDGE